MFGHKPQQRFINYADVRAEIENDTKAIVRDGMGVSNLPINLTIFSPHGNSFFIFYFCAFVFLLLNCPKN